MNRRPLIIAVMIVLCAYLLWAVIGQQQRLVQLSAEQKSLLAKLESSGAEPEVRNEAGPGADQAPNSAATPEVLLLRNEVTTLSQRRRELEGVRAKNAQLRGELASSEVNRPGCVKGYIRKSQARYAGYGTPEDTLQSFLWAMQQQNASALLNAVVPDMVDELGKQLENPDAAKKLFGEKNPFVGIGVESRKELPDGSLQLSVQIVPGAPPLPMLLRRIGNEWKIDFRAGGL